MTRSTSAALRAVGSVGIAVAVALLPACGGGARRGAPGAAVSARTTITADPARRFDVNKVWSWLAPPPGSAGMPVADGRNIALTAGHEDVVLLDGKGNVQWQAERVGVRDVAPALTADLVIAATDDGVVAYDRGSGKKRWEATLGERANTPVVVGPTAVVTTWEGSLVGIDAGTGRVSWRMALGGDALGPPAAGPASAGIAIATFDSGDVAGVVAVEPASGRLRWRVPLAPGAVSAPAVVADAHTVVLVGSDVAAHGLSLDDGSERWRRPLDGAGSPEVPPLPQPDGKVLIAHRLGGIALVDGRDGTVAWTARSEDDVAVRGGPAGPGPKGWFVLPLNGGSVLLGGPDRPTDQRAVPGLTTGVAVGPGGLLLVATGQGSANGLYAYEGW